MLAAPPEHQRDAANCLARAQSERPGKADFVAVWVGDVKEALAPGGVARRALGAIAGGDQASVEGVDIAVVEDRPAPPAHFGQLGDQVEETVACAKAGEACTLAAIEKLEAAEPVEAHGGIHVPRRQGDRAEGGDHFSSFVIASGAKQSSSVFALRGEGIAAVPSPPRN